MAPPPIATPPPVPIDPAAAAALARTLDALGTPPFFDAMLDFLGAACAMQAGGVMAFFRHRRPRRFVHRFDAISRSLPEDRYLEGPYALDPAYQHFLRGAATGVHPLGAIAPDDFFTSEYYRQFHSRIGVSDAVDVLWRLDDDTAWVFFLERGTGAPPFSEDDLAALRGWLPVVAAACTRHHALTQDVPSAEADALTHRRVEHTISNFGRSLLTKREREVLFHMLSGYSAALTAERLATTEGTIKIHRKNIHRKLDIGSQAELFSLFIQCIPFAVPGEETDPLEAYQKQR